MNAIVLEEKMIELLDLFREIKQEIKRRDRHKYEQWRAGGFIVDDDVVSMYPNLEKVVASVCDDEE